MQSLQNLPQSLSINMNSCIILVHMNVDALYAQMFEEYLFHVS